MEAGADVWTNDVSTADAALAVKPAMGSIHAPSDWVDPPEVNEPRDPACAPPPPAP